MKYYFKVGKYYSYESSILAKNKIACYSFLVLRIFKTDDVCSRLTILTIGENRVRTQDFSIFNLPKEMKA